MKTVGLILASIHAGAALDVWSSFARRASSQGLTLFIFPGGKLGSKSDLEYLRNGVYRLACKQNLDALISWSSAIGYTIPPEDFAAFHARFGDLPLVTIAHKVAGHPCVSFDAYQGMKNLVLHFTADHDASRVAFLRGPRTNATANDRLRGYYDALETCGIPGNKRLISDPFGWDEGEAACVQLVEQRDLLPGRDFDVLIGSSDLMVFPALSYLASRGFACPRDFLAGGFNNSVESSAAANPLTTACIPYDELARKCFDNIGAEGSEAADADLSCDLVLRESCGCGTRAMFLAENEALFFNLLKRETLHSALNSLKCEFLGLCDRASLLRSLACHLPLIGIHTGALILYAELSTGGAETPGQGDFSRCIGSFHKEATAPRACVIDKVKSFNSALLLPPDIKDQYTTGAFMVQPLYIEDKALGYFVHNVPFYDGVILEELRSSISNALKGIALFEAAVHAKEAADRAEREKNTFFAAVGRYALFIGLDVEFPSWGIPAAHIPNMSEFEDTVARANPSLVVLGDMDEEAVKTIRHHSGTVLTPIVVLPERFADEEPVEHLCKQTRLLLCNRCVASSAEFSLRVRKVAAGDGILPAYTGALVKKTLLYFNQRFDAHVSRWKLADTVNVSEDYLTRIFRKEMGFSLWEYLNRYRVETAADLLIRTDDTISQIASAVGFQDQAYFCRVFKKITGKAPGSIRTPSLSA